MKLPDDVRQLILRRFREHCGEWLAAGEEGPWPWEIVLGTPTEQHALRQVEGVRCWVGAWQRWQGAGSLSWRERRWSSLGVQRLPEKLILHGPEDAAGWIGQGDRWSRALSRYTGLVASWPALRQHLRRYFDILADYSEADYQRLWQMLTWISGNLNSNLYPRQLPIGGLDSKWLEGRKRVISDLVAAIRQDSLKDLNFYQRCGLKAPPALIRMRVLDPQLRTQLGGLRDISAPIEELAALDLVPAHVFIVENLQTALAFSDLPGTVVLMGLGYGVEALSQLTWIAGARCVYWGDIDTHGLAILNRARNHLVELDSVLMDEETLLRHREFWVTEEKPHPALEQALLTKPEQELYTGLKQQRWGQGVRLEQERIPWDTAWKIVQELVERHSDHRQVEAP